MDANQLREDEQIKTFISVTGADVNTARHFLEASVWDLNSATANFYSSDNAKTNYKPSPTPSKKPEPIGSKPVHEAKIATLSSYESDSQNNFYTGGKSSGLQVEGNPENKPKSIVDKIFQKKSDAIPEKKEPPKTFGTGFKLGNAPTAPVVAIKDEPKPQEENPTISVVFWRQGFVVDDGPLRKYDQPENAAFLKDIDNGVVPRELQNRLKNTSTAVNVQLTDKKHTDYEEPIIQKPKVISFSGTAQKLGDSSNIPKVESKKTTITSSGGSNSGNNKGGNARIQIRMADGSVIRATFDMNQTIADIKEHINSVKPQSKDYMLLIPYPRAVLSDPNQTIQEADLNNACIAQKYI